ncbi:MAG: chloride channel protein [Planctomycetes bacterium]|nr:chloride channel protein [Planctomycetota bacterium]
MARLSLFRGNNARAEPWLMAALAALVGVASSAVAVALRSGVHSLFEALHSVRESTLGALLPAAGAFLGVWLIRVAFREPGGHGVPAVLEAVSRRGGYMRKRSIISRLFGSLVNVASGGSAGLEGPIAFSAAAVGSTVAGGARMAERQRILLLACGVAGGIGAIFNAPLTGVIFATEVVLAEWTLSAVIPVTVSATVATGIGRAVLGVEGAFHSGSFEWSATDLALSPLLGLSCGLLSVLLVGAIFRTEHLAARLKKGAILGKVGVVAALAGLCVGAIGYAEPGAIGEGYGIVSDALQGQLHGGIGLLALLLVAKWVATVLTLGSNAPGGIFAPSLVLGAILGFLFGTMLQAIAPTATLAQPGFYALLAMAGLVAGTMQAPFTGMFLALETTGGWSETLPLMLVAVLSALVSRSFLRHSFYTWDLAESGRLLRPGTDKRILSDLQASEMLDKEFATILIGKSLEDLAAVLPTTRRNHFAVIDEQGRFQGMLDLSHLRSVIFDPLLRKMTPVDTAMNSHVPRIRQHDSLLHAMEVFEEVGAWVLPVVDDNEVFLGTLSKSTLFDNYRRELIVQTAGRAE